MTIYFGFNFSALEAVLNKRAFIISRATFLGQGQYSGHWSGDIFSSWEDLKFSIPSECSFTNNLESNIKLVTLLLDIVYKLITLLFLFFFKDMLNFNLFGIPFVGADICGFNGNTTSELCARWSALGAFYSFSRNHNTDNTIEQDPVALGSLVVSSAKYALELRYCLLPYLYTLFFKSHTAGETVVRPLFFEFPKENEVYSIDTQFLWGDSVMVIPVLEQNKNQTLAYFPKARWYNFAEQTLLVKNGGRYLLLNIPLDKIVVAVRGGSILALHPPGPTTTEARKGKFSLFTALDEKEKAYGQLYWDDGESLNKFKNFTFSLINFNFEKVNIVNLLKNKLTLSFFLFFSGYFDY